MVLQASAEQVNLAELMTMQPLNQQHKEPNQSAGWSFLARTPAPPCLAFLWPWKPLSLLGTPARRVAGPLALKGRN